MSYSTLDSHGGISTTYAHARGGVHTQGPGRTWWPDFGPGTRDFSAQERSHPSEAIFEKIVKPGKWSTREKSIPNPEPVAARFRSPQPARDAMQDQAPSIERKLAAHAVTERQAALRRMEMRQRRVDSWLEDAPVRMNASTLSEVSWHSSSEPSLRELSTSQASQVSRDVYQRHGYLVGRSKGSIADGVSGARPRRHNPLSYSAMMFSGDLYGSPSHKTGKMFRPRKPTQQWRMRPESRFVFDPRSCLPVPRGGWNSLPPTKWPEVEAAGNREFVPGQESFCRTFVPGSGSVSSVSSAVDKPSSVAS
mmetsp:Transcript_81076/g.224337  ORF Transcript_81076/g.224337 Transcript_81076/m.224337 type:complete len:307 (-) Transcript_81076:159-1079(-)